MLTPVPGPVSPARSTISSRSFARSSSSRSDSGPGAARGGTPRTVSPGGTGGSYRVGAIRRVSAVAPISVTVKAMAARVQNRARRSLPPRTAGGRAARSRSADASSASRWCSTAGSDSSGSRSATASRACSSRFAAAGVLASVSAAVSGRPSPTPSYSTRVRRYGGGRASRTSSRARSEASAGGGSGWR
ncbi:hypothetical protein SGLAM104S_07038 [Streptomyces glaucescens]